jgi:hypothetical protein
MEWNEMNDGKMYIVQVLNGYQIYIAAPQPQPANAVTHHPSF